jgi:hypothetical protein
LQHYGILPRIEAVAEEPHRQCRPRQPRGRLQTMKNEGLTILDHSNSCSLFSVVPLMIRRLALFGGWQLTDKVYYADSYEGTSNLLAEERTP